MSVSTLAVNTRRHGFKVVRVPAVLGVAQMVNVETLRDRAAEPLKADAVDEARLPIVEDAAITPLTEALPQPAGIGKASLGNQSLVERPALNRMVGVDGAGASPSTVVCPAPSSTPSGAVAACYGTLLAPTRRLHNPVGGPMLIPALPVQRTHGARQNWSLTSFDGTQGSDSLSAHREAPLSGVMRADVAASRPLYFTTEPVGYA